MQDQPSPRRPRRLTAVLLVAFLVSSAVAAYALVRLQQGERAAAPRDRTPASPTEEPAGEEEGDLLDRILEELEGALGGGDAAAAVFDCLEVSDLLSGLLTAQPQPRGLEATVRAVGREVERIRELAFEDPVDAEFVAPSEIAARVSRQVVREYPARLAERDQRILEALGAIPPGTDLRALLARALGQQVAGFYDPRTGELVVRAGSARVGTLARVTLAHELEHALVDQTLGIPLPDEPDPEREDADLAALALVEGDATLTMQRFALSLSIEDQLKLFDPAAFLQAQAGLEAMPYFLQRELLFPYEQGMLFVCDLYARGGWQAVNQAYASPPRATVEVLFPDRYPGPAPVDPADPPAPDASWDAVETRPLGAATLLWLLEAPGGDASRAVPDALEAVSTWRGGEVHVWARGDDAALAVALEAEGERLCGAVERWYRSAFPIAREAAAEEGERFALDGPAQDAVLTCPSGEVRLGIAPDVATARRVAA